MEYSRQSRGPLRKRDLEEVRGFLARMGLAYDERIEFTTILRDEEDQIAATASLQGNVVKCVAVDPASQGENLTATLLTSLRQEAIARGYRQLFLYTKPKNEIQFASLGFHKIASAEGVLLMEDRRGGFSSWVEEVRRPEAQGVIGCLVMNCNPMTLGHCYLIERAAGQCDFLYLLVVTEDKSAVPADRRREIVEKTVADLPNVTVAGTSRYLISAATFPDYFLKEKPLAERAWCDLDIAVFCRLAEELRISRRFVGTEPFCPVTEAYNRAMAAALPAAGVELIEIPRLEQNGRAVSATEVRKLVEAGDWQAIGPMVPEATFEYFSKAENREAFMLRQQK